MTTEPMLKIILCQIEGDNICQLAEFISFCRALSHSFFTINYCYGWKNSVIYNVFVNKIHDVNKRLK